MHGQSRSKTCWPIQHEGSVLSDSDHRIFGVGRDLKVHPFHLLPWTGTPPTRSVCSKHCPIQLWMFLCGASTTSLGSQHQGLIMLIMKNFFLISQSRYFSSPTPVWNGWDFCTALTFTVMGLLTRPSGLGIFSVCSACRVVPCTRLGFCGSMWVELIIEHFKPSSWWAGPRSRGFSHPLPTGVELR